MSNIAFLGAGNIAQAIMGGLADTDAKIIAADPSEDCHMKVRDLGITVTDDNDAAVAQADIVMLCVKPNVLPGLLRKLHVTDGKLFISVAAGVTITTITDALGKNCPVIRCMPNTPALVGAGMTGMFAGPGVLQAQKTEAETILAAVGSTLWVDIESDLDIVTAVSGSGPAYFFMLMEAMVNAAVTEGLGADVARQLVLETALGSAKIALGNTSDPAELRRQVTSPGGTTEAALNCFTNGGFEALVKTAIAAARSRAVELSQS